MSIISTFSGEAGRGDRAEGASRGDRRLLRCRKRSAAFFVVVLRDSGTDVLAALRFGTGSCLWTGSGA